MAYLRGVTSAPVPPPLFKGRSKTRMLFHGWDGSVWDVTSGRFGVYLMPEGLEGLGMPDIENYTFSSPVVHGVEWEDWRATGREVHWVIGVFEDDSEDWLELKTQFWRIFQPGKVLRWEVILPNSQRYNLYVRFKTDHTSVYSRDPVYLGWAIYGITGFTEQPFWEGETQSPIWYPGSDEDFYGPTGFGPDFIISPASTIGTARITNPGDVEAFMRWELKGPFTSATVGYDGYSVTVGNTLEGSTVVLNTDPRDLTATRDGVDIMTSLGQFDFVPIPSGTDITLSLAMDGDGSIQAFFTPLYFRSV